MYVVPMAASESPASGDANLLGCHIKILDQSKKNSLRRFASGSSHYFVGKVV